MDGLEATPLQVAMTRPALLWGVPLELGVVLIVGVASAGIIAHNILYDAVIVPLWWAAALLVRRDYNALRVSFLWLLTSAFALDSHLWGGASVPPLPIQPSGRYRGIAPDAW